MSTSFLFFLLACESPTPGPQVEEAPLSALTVPSSARFDDTLPSGTLPIFPPGGQVPFRLLDHLDTAVIQLPPHNLEANRTQPRTIEGEWVPARPGNGWKIRLDPELVPDIQAGTPRNLRLVVNGQTLPYRSGSTEYIDGRAFWSVQNRWLIVRGLGDPEHWSQSARLERISQTAASERLNFEPSGLDAVEFVRADITIEEFTRRSLLLPAPGSISMDVTLPRGDAHLRFGVGMATIPGFEFEAEARVELLVDDRPIWERTLQSDRPWQDIEVPLTDWAGETVRLTIRSAPLGSEEADWVVLAEPEILGTEAETPPLRIIVIGLDTLRPDHLGIHGYPRDTSPFLDDLAEQSLLFESAWAPAPRTRPSFRTINTGRWPLSAREAPTLGALLSAEGFSTAGIVANVHLSPEMGFSEGYGLWRYAHSGEAEDQVDRALAWLTEHQEENSFLFLHFMDPHIFYLAPEPWTDRFTSAPQPEHLPDRYNRSSVSRLEAEGMLDEATRSFIRGRYDGEIGYLDSELSRLFENVDALPGRTWFVLVSDHGEEFWEHGGFEHNHSLYGELTRALFWIRPPTGSWPDAIHRSNSDVSVADIVPTVLDMAGIPVESRPPLDGLSLLPLLDGSNATERAALVRTLGARALPMGHLMYGSERWGVVFDRHKYILHRWTGEQELYDLDTDPEEQRNLVPGTTDMSIWWSSLESATGYPTGSGWHLALSGLNQTLTLRLEDPIRLAEVVDPESARERRANQEWGIEPPSRSADFARVELDDTGRILTIEPGGLGHGRIALLGEPSRIQVFDPDGELGDLVIGRDLSLSSGLRIEATRSVVILAGETESLLPRVTTDSETTSALESLGYLE